MTQPSHQGEFATASGRPRGAHPPDPAGDVAGDGGCVPNISPRERRKRLRFGGIALGLALLVLAGLLTAGLDRWWRLGLFPLLWAAALGYFQARDKT